MDVNKNATIKLFGKRILLSLQAGGDEEKFQNRDEDEHEQKEEQRPKLKNQDQETPDSQERCEATTSESDNRKPPLIELESSISEEQGGGASESTEKTTAKKPDKILPCPRCKSMDTKFCYYNNYNVNQPRHFCKNCQRYWTAGGTMRNVPVGAGRRKNKNSCPYLHIAIPKSAVQALQPDETVLRYHPCLAPSGAVLSFGSSAPPGKTKKNSPGSDGFHQAPPSPVPRAMNTGGETSAPFPCFNGSTWPPYPWNQPLPLCAASIPVPVYPAAYWSRASATPPATWCLPLPFSAASSSSSSSSSSIFPSCRKHSRDEKDSGKQNQDACMLVPKTLRIDDPEAAAKSSIWTMVGIKSSKNTTVSGGDLLKAFQPRVDVKNHAMETPLLLHANHAALSRSLNFQESC